MFPTGIFEKKRVLMGITGGIAAYKACEIIRYLVTYGADVRAMMTDGATKFITELTIETLTNHPVYTNMFPQKFAATHHIEAADWAEMGVVVPATANIVGKLANGIGDDFVSTTLLAMHCPTVIAPAMNNHMWFHPAMQRNIATLRDWGYLICNPEEGFLAEGYSGMGRLARPEFITQFLYRAAHPQPESLRGKTVLITAGRTEEMLDPVRMFTNRSTGKMGFALAWEAFARGATVILVHGPAQLTPPVGVTSIAVRSAQEMLQAVEKHIEAADIYISAAAIADYRPKKISGQKIKKQDGDFAVEMDRTVDVLKTMGGKKLAHQQFVGFAVETDQPEKNARNKLKNKNLDLVVLNNPNESGAAFAGDTNIVTIIGKNDSAKIAQQYKLDVSRAIFDALIAQKKGEGSDE